MSSLTFKLIKEPRQRVDLSLLHPSRLTGKTLEQIGRMPVQSGKRKQPLSELFDITGDSGSIKQLMIQNASDKLEHIGQDLANCQIEVSGHVGDYLGQNMVSGGIDVKGDAGDWVGTGMHGGQIRIHGNAGDHIASARPGDPTGMNQGLIHIMGNAGDRIGDRMRRGIVILEGNAGDYCGARMLAGTIMVVGQAGRFTGFSMKRGSLILAHEPAHIPASFNLCGSFELNFLSLMLNKLAPVSKAIKRIKDTHPTVKRYAGDLAWDGQGELLIL